MPDSLIEWPEPLFVPGEEVGVHGFKEAGYDSDMVLVTRVDWGLLHGYKGWMYGTDHVNAVYAFSEPSLIKLPADSVTAWNKCIFTPEGIDKESK